MSPSVLNIMIQNWQTLVMLKYVTHLHNQVTVINGVLFDKIVIHWISWVKHFQNLSEGSTSHLLSDNKITFFFKLKPLAGLDIFWGICTWWNELSWDGGGYTSIVLEQTFILLWMKKKTLKLFSISSSFLGEQHFRLMIFHPIPWMRPSVRIWSKWVIHTNWKKRFERNLFLKEH